MNIIENIKEAGLTGNEAIVYLELLKRGSSGASNLAKKISFDRTLTYQLLNNLIDKGLVNYIIKEDKKYFSAADPENLLRPIETKERIIKNIIPHLQNITNLQEVKQEVEIYEGKIGLKILFNKIGKAKNICIFGGSGKSYDILKYEMPKLAKEIMKKGLHGRLIIHKNQKGKQYTKFNNLEVGYTTAKTEATSTTIFGDTIAISSLQEKPLIIIIKNQFIANTYRNYFNFMWKHAEK